MSKAAERYAPESQPGDVQRVKEHLSTHKGDPPPGVAPGEVGQAVREQAVESRETPVRTQRTQERGGLDVGAGTPDVPKQDPATKVGQPTAEHERDASPVGNDPALEAEVSQVRAEFAKAGVTGGEEVRITQHQEPNQSVVEKVPEGDRESTPESGGQVDPGTPDAESSSSPAAERYADRAEPEPEQPAPEPEPDA